MYPPLQASPPLPASLKALLRQPLPAQALTISGVTKHLNTARSAIIVGECGTGKTLMSVAVAHTHSDAGSYTVIAMCPPHLVFKWAREVLETIPRARTFIIYDLRNGGDPTRPHGVVEVQQRNGQIIHKGLKATLLELRTIGRVGWRKLCPSPAYFIVSRETGKLSYHWKHAYTIAESGRERGLVTNPDTGRAIPRSEAISAISFAERRKSSSISHAGRRVLMAFPRCGRPIARTFSAWRRLDTSAVT